MCPSCTFAPPSRPRYNRPCPLPSLGKSEVPPPRPRHAMSSQLGCPPPCAGPSRHLALHCSHLWGLLLPVSIPHDVGLLPPGFLSPMFCPLQPCSFLFNTGTTAYSGFIHTVAFFLRRRSENPVATPTPLDPSLKAKYSLRHAPSAGAGAYALSV